MAITSNTYTGNGSNKLFSITFPYLETSDIDVYLNGTLQTITTQYFFANATTVEFVAAPANGAIVLLDRSTSDSTLSATFFPGSSIKAADLNDNFDQTLYVVQEINNELDGFKTSTNASINNLSAVKLNKTGDTMAGTLSMGNQRLTDLPTPSLASDAVTLSYVNTAVSSSQIAGTTRWVKTIATAGATVSGNDDNGNTLVYISQREQVYLNGACLSRDSDYTATTGTSIVFTVPLLVGDVVQVFSLNNIAVGGNAVDVTFSPSGSGAVPRSTASKLKDVLSVKDFGAKGDNSTDDTAAIQACINAAEAAYRGVVLFPRGLYRISASLQLPSYVTLRGETKEGCWITNQGAPLNAPHIVNKDPVALIFAAVENLSFLYATYGIKIDVTAEVAGLKFENVWFFSHTEASFYCNKVLQTSTFDTCNFDTSKYGFRVPAFTSNANTFVNCGFLNNTEANVELYISEVNNFISCRFEGAGVVSKPTIKVYQAKALNFIGCYFEKTNSILLQETGSFNSVKFEGNHFTGAYYSGNWQKYTFESDGIVQFGGNNWGEAPSDGPAKMLVTGINSSIANPTKMLGSKDSTTYVTATRSAYNIVSPVVPCPAGLTQNLITVNKLVTDAALSNLNMLSGILTTNLYALEAGGNDNVHAGMYRVTFRSVGAANIVVTITTINSTTIAGGVTATLTSAGIATSATVAITFAGATPATQISSAFQWSFECLNTGTTRNDIMIPQIA